MRKTSKSFVLAALACLAVPLAAVAGTYPDKNLRMIVPYAPGGGTDVMARTVAQYMENALGKKIVVVNKPGASGQVGMAEGAEARPDGYTLVMLSSSDFVLSPLLNRDPGYAESDYIPVASFNETSHCLIVKEGSPFKTFAEFVAYARDNPGKLTVSCSGSGHMLLASLIELKAGAKLSMVNYSSGGENINALLGGHVDAAMVNMMFINQARQSNCTVLGLASPARFDILPDVPTMREAGFDIADTQRRVLAVQAGASQEVVDVLTKAAESFGDTKEFRDRLVSMTEVPKLETGAELAAFMKSHKETYREVIESNRDKFPMK